ncbi:MAG TPA: hypothetical protein VHX19_03895 [Stellaceae bacterium]|jgi:hypothetical protein|nr:hypothetical protein [Stellaceae bacterium]
MSQHVAVRNALLCTPDGIFILSGQPLVQRRGNTFVRTSQQDICNLSAALYGPEVVYGPLFPMLERAARFLERGLFEAAKETIEKLELPALTTAGEQLMRIAPGFFEPDKHPRWPAGQPDGGQFRPVGGDGDTNDLPTILPVADFSGGFHDAVVDAWMDYFKQNGIPAVKAPGIRLIGPDARVIGYPDIIVNDPRIGLPWTAFEIKTGSDPTYTRAQAMYYPLLQLGGHVYSTDPRIASLGLVPGVPFPPMVVMTVRAPGPGLPYDYHRVPPPQFEKAYAALLCAIMRTRSFEERSRERRFSFARPG